MCVVLVRWVCELWIRKCCIYASLNHHHNHNHRSSATTITMPTIVRNANARYMTTIQRHKILFAVSQRYRSDWKRTPHCALESLPRCRVLCVCLCVLKVVTILTISWLVFHTYSICFWKATTGLRVFRRLLAWTVLFVGSRSVAAVIAAPRCVAHSTRTLRREMPASRFSWYVVRCALRSWLLQWPSVAVIMFKTVMLV